MKEEKQFETESRQLLDLMINSIYSNKEIFLRELISNASDAIDKYKFLSLSDTAKYPSKDYLIRINVNKDERSIEIVDNGIGMSKTDMEKNLGTIAKSGSKDFVKKYKEAKDSKDLSIIGQFGVGFYSAFMVASKVEVRSKPTGGKGTLFTSTGKDTYTVEDIDYPVDSGTSVKVFLKKDTDDEKYSDFLNEFKIEELVKKYSDYIRYPIKMVEKHQENDKDKDGKDIPNKTHEVKEDKTLNSMIPLWKKPKAEVDEKAMNEFYKNKFDDYEDPLMSLYIKVEGTISYSALVYIPSHAPYNLYSENYEKGLALYSKGIFIQDKCKDLVPDYLKFLKGLVDSEDFPLNISREMLQKSPLMDKIAKNIESKVLEKLKDMMKNDPTKYDKFFTVYGDYLKYGIYSSYGMKKESLQDLLLYPSLNSGDKKISLKDYEEKMKPEQKDIYYASGKTLDEIRMLPQMEKYRKNGLDVLLLADDIDEFVLMMMHDYDKKEFKNITAEDKEDLSKEEKDKLDSLTALYKRFLDDVKEALPGKVDAVEFSDKLVDSPVCITTKEGLSLNMEHVLEKQPGVKNEPDSEKPKAIKVLEINPDHELFKTLAKVTDDKEIRKYGSLLYDEALLLEGYEVEDKKAFVKNLNDLMMVSATGKPEEAKPTETKVETEDKKA